MCQISLRKCQTGSDFGNFPPQKIKTKPNLIQHKESWLWAFVHNYRVCWLFSWLLWLFCWLFVTDNRTNHSSHMKKSFISGEVLCSDTEWIHFNGSCYLAVMTQRSWADADVDCQSRGGYLPSIHSKNEDNFLTGKGESLCLFDLFQTCVPTTNFEWELLLLSSLASERCAWMAGRGEGVVTSIQ